VSITEQQIVDGYMALIEKLDWNRIAIISDDDELIFNVSNGNMFYIYVGNNNTSFDSQATTYTEEKLI